MTESYDFTLLDPPFWTPGGWERVKPPEAYVNACKNEMWEAGLREQGYSVWYGWGEELDDYQAKVWANDRDGHLMISLWNCERETGVFFVSPRWRVAFLVDKLPQMLSVSAKTKLTSDMETVRKALVAFVRHGHGEDTIDEFGYTRDERRHDAAMARIRTARAKTND